MVSPNASVPTYEQPFAHASNRLSTTAAATQRSAPPPPTRFAGGPAASNTPSANVSIMSFFRYNWRGIVGVFGVVLLVVLFAVLYNSTSFNAWWNGLFPPASNSSRMLLPRATNVSVVASEKSNDKYYTTQVDPTVTPPLTPPRPDPAPVSPSDKEVFNVSNNIYSYEDAPAVCQAFGAKLATAKQVQSAYSNGADWCNYGWTGGQLALYPTQTKTYDTLQKIEGHEHDCGIVGVNGGYFQNPDLQFGVNCYGKKPEPSVKEKDLIGYFPDYVSEKEKRLQERVAQIKQNITGLSVTPFNSTSCDEQRTIPERIADVFD